MNLSRVKGNKRNYGVSNLEWMIIIGFATFGVFWSILIPFISKNVWYLSLNPPSQYLFYNIGSLMLIIAFLGVPLDYFFEEAVSVLGVVRSGIASFTIFAVLDLWQPPFAYGWNGTLLITNPDAMPGAAIDTVLGWIWTHVGFIGTPLYLMIYAVTPTMAIITAAILFKPKTLLKLIER